MRDGAALIIIGDMVTAFQEKVYRAVSRIPRGKVTTYREVAAQVGCRSCQAVGQALRANPFAPVVPCHRVIATGLTVGGFCGRRRGTAIRRKLALLRREGVAFKAGRLVDPRRVHHF